MNGVVNMRIQKKKNVGSILSYLDFEMPITRVRAHLCLGVVIGDRLTWRSEVAQAMAAGRRALSVLQIMYGHSCVGS